MNKGIKEQTFEKKEIDFKKITLIQFICAILVVLLHADNVVSFPNASVFEIGFVRYFTHGICTAAVPIFFVLSGFLFFRNISDESGMRAVGKKILSRIKTVLVPFLVWSGIYYIFYAVCNRVLGLDMLTPVDISIKGIIRGILFYEYCFPLWYMAQLFVFILMTPIVFVILKNKYAKFLVLALLIICSIVCKGGNVGWPFGLSTRSIFSANFFMYFYIGCLCARVNVRNITDKVNRIPFVALFIITLVSGALSAAVYEEIILTPFLRIAVPLIASAVLAMLIKISNNTKFTSKVNSIAKNVPSMLIYTLHPLVGQVVGQVVNFDSLGVIPSFILKFLSVTFISCLAAFIIKRFLKPIYPILCGR
ncbi:MAG: acyltransferase [Clostridia bacterium]|nr:acyltransferase [Clostridia bacterium]